MKTKVLFCGVLAVAALTGCQTAHIKTAEWEASINSHWFKRDVDKLTVTRTADGGYSIALNGYTGDASERLPQFTREMFAGLVALGQLVPMAARTAPATTYRAPATATAPATPAATPTATCADGSCDDPDAPATATPPAPATATAPTP